MIRSKQRKGAVQKTTPRFQKYELKNETKKVVAYYKQQPN